MIEHNVLIIAKGQRKGRHLGRQAEVYATSAGEGSVGVGALKEGAEAKGIGAGRIKETSLGAYFFASAKNSFISAGRRS
jgi:hypothetical protein